MKSLILVVVFFPLLLPVWEKGPFNLQNVKQPEAVTYLSPEEIAVQEKIFQRIKDPRIRSKIATVFSKANNTNAVKSLEDMLRTEKNTLVIEDILAALYVFRNKAELGQPNNLKEFFKSSSPNIRAYAIGLYLASSGDSSAALKALETENSPFVINTLWGQLVKDGSKFNPERAEKFLKSKNILQRAGAAEAIAALSDNPDDVQALKDVLQDKNPFVRCALARGLALRKNGGNGLISELSEDKNITVRGIIASVPATEKRENLFTRLLDDKDWDVRMRAAISLGNYKTMDAIDALLSRLGNKYAPVRAAVEDSLVKIKPGKSAIDKIDEELENKSKQNAAIRILGLLDAKDSSTKIFDILKNTNETETIVRAIDALGRLHYKKAAEEIADFSDNKTESVRKATAFALGKLGVKSTFASLVKLSSDKNIPVSLEAIEAMGRIGSNYFSPRLLKIINNTSSSGNAEKRSVACWSIAKIDSPDEKTVMQLKNIFLKKVIACEGEKVYDSDFTRAAAVLALLKLAQTHQDMKKGIDKTIDYFFNNPFKMEGEDSPLLEDYMRQVSLFKEGKEIPAAKMEPITPHLVVNQIKKKTKKKRASVFGPPGK